MGADPRLRVPAAMRETASQVTALTDDFCAEHMDAEYAELCRRLVAKLSRKRPSPLARGDVRVWAAARALPEPLQLQAAAGGMIPALAELQRRAAG